MRKILHPKTLVLDPDTFVYAFINARDLPDRELRELWMPMHQRAKVVYDSIPSQRHIVVMPTFEFSEVERRVSYLTEDDSKGAYVGRQLRELLKKGLAREISDEEILSIVQNRKYFEGRMVKNFVVIATCCLNEVADLVSSDYDLTVAIRTTPIDTSAPYRINIYALQEHDVQYLEETFDPI